MLGRRFVEEKVRQPIGQAMAVALTALALAFVALMIAVSK